MIHVKIAILTHKTEVCVFPSEVFLCWIYSELPIAHWYFINISKNCYSNWQITLISPIKTIHYPTSLSHVQVFHWNYFLWSCCSDYYFILHLKMSCSRHTTRVLNITVCRRINWVFIKIIDQYKKENI